MMSSVALPKVALRSPPEPGPRRFASSSVEMPMKKAIGMMVIALMAKMTSGETSANTKTTLTAKRIPIRA